MARVTARFAAVVCAIATLPATAAGYPEKPIRILTPFSAGSVTDLLARRLPPNSPRRGASRRGRQSHRGGRQHRG